MKPRLFLSAALLLVGMLLLVTPALAGGWAVITLDELPGEVIAGQPLEIGFIVRQHGVTPMAGLTPVVSAHQADFNVTEQAKAQGETGHYVATLTFPQAGEWEWSIQAFTVDQPMPTLSVMNTSTVSQSKALIRVPANLPILAGSLGLASLVIGLFVALRRKARWAYLLALAGLLLGGASVVYAANPSQTQADEMSLSPSSTPKQVELGRQLFIAKGCMVCHSHNQTNQTREFGTDIGPNLTNIAVSPEYLRMWLKDPKAVKPNTQMPTLGLSETEIEALIAFINAD